MCSLVFFSCFLAFVVFNILVQDILCSVERSVLLGFCSMCLSLKRNNDINLGSILYWTYGCRMFADGEKHSQPFLWSWRLRRSFFQRMYQVGLIYDLVLGLGLPMIFRRLYLF
nr:hypothetical protein [Cressdnaviricota sp.]